MKLNNYVMNHIPGKICVYPLCGDQGCGFGLYRFYHGTFNFKTLLIGKRDLSANSDAVKYVESNNVKRFGVFNDREAFVNKVAKLLRDD